MKKGYTTRQEIENFLLITIDESFHDQVDTWIEWAENYIDKLTGRNFVADEEASARLFDGVRGQELPIDECVAVTKVERRNGTGDTWTEIPATGLNSYVELPTNRRGNDGETEPIDRLAIRSGYWNRGYQNYRVTARWGYSEEAPGVIKKAATLIAAGFLNYGRTGNGENVKSETIGSYSVTYDTPEAFEQLDQALNFLASYKRMAL